MGSAHFAGFFIGCWWPPRLVGVFGNSRAFAVFAAAGTVGTLLHMKYVDPYAWSAVRILSGMRVAGCFTVTSSGMGLHPVPAASFLFGATTFLIHSLASANANDFADPEEMVAHAAQRSRQPGSLPQQPVLLAAGTFLHAQANDLEARRGCKPILLFMRPRPDLPSGPGSPPSGCCAGMN